MDKTQRSNAGPAAIAHHICRHPDCGKWGAWGYDGGHGIADWWCLQHRPDEDPAVAPQAEGNWISDANEG